MLSFTFLSKNSPAEIVKRSRQLCDSKGLGEGAEPYRQQGNSLIPRVEDVSSQ